MNDRLEEYIDSLDRRISSLQAQRERVREGLVKEVGADRSYDEVDKVWRGHGDLATLISKRQRLLDELGHGEEE